MRAQHAGKENHNGLTWKRKAYRESSLISTILWFMTEKEYGPASM